MLEYYVLMEKDYTDDADGDNSNRETIRFIDPDVYKNSTTDLFKIISNCKEALKQTIADRTFWHAEAFIYKHEGEKIGPDDDVANDKCVFSVEIYRFSEEIQISVHEHIYNSPLI